jgi:formamidase
MHARNAGDYDLDPAAPADPRMEDPLFGTVHPLTGPVYVEGARAGDVLAVRLHHIEPGPWAWSIITGSGLVSDVIPGPIDVRWNLGREAALSEDVPGVRIPNASFPGVVTVLPGPEQHAAMLEREQALAETDATVFRPHPLHASPAEVCGPGGSHESECLRTIPPREHGGNMDIRYLQSGVTIYLPCHLDGCGLAIGDLHYAQGDGEVSGTALEMDATVTLSVDLLKDGPDLSRGPHYEGPARLLGIPSRRFYATTGFPLKAAGEMPPRMRYLKSGVVLDLENLSDDLTLASRNALLAMIDHIVETYGYTREQAYIIASVAVDLRIGQVVDQPNVGVSAVLPLDIFEGP